MYQADLIRIATESGRAVDDVLELWSERAAIREYCGGQSRNDAEREAMIDVVCWIAERTQQSGAK